MLFSASPCLLRGAFQVQGLQQTPRASLRGRSGSTQGSRLHLRGRYVSPSCRNAEKAYRMSHKYLMRINFLELWNIVSRRLGENNVRLHSNVSCSRLSAELSCQDWPAVGIDPPPGMAPEFLPGSLVVTAVWTNGHGTKDWPAIVEFSSDEHANYYRRRADFPPVSSSVHFSLVILRICLESGIFKGAFPISGFSTATTSR